MRIVEANVDPVLERRSEDHLANRARVVVDIAEPGVQAGLVERGRADEPDLLLRREEQLDARMRPPVLHEPRELFGRDEPVLPSVLLARPLLARGCGHRQLDFGHSLEQDLLERAFAGARGAGDDEDQWLSGGRGQSAQTVAGRRGLPPSSTD